jgi:hypothetical protein
MTAGADKDTMSLLQLFLLGWLCITSPLAVVSKQAVVFDIDGTLTQDVADLFTVHPGAVEAVTAYQDLGYVVVLVTARPWWARWATWAWLRLNHFPTANLEMRTAPRLYFDDNSTTNYKRRVLSEFVAGRQFDFVYGYGDSTSDFMAYETTPVDNVFALKRRFTQGNCLPGRWIECLQDYREHVEVYIRAQPPAQ